MDFKLVYQGQLRATTGSKTRIREKHHIRKQFHKQLKELWRIHPTLSKLGEARTSEPGAPNGVYATIIEATANKFARCGYRFVPLVTNDLSLSCFLDVVLLRRDHPGSVVTYGGDIDNRLKTLFDALRMPTSDELPKVKPDADEDPFFVLLQDDSQITRVSVATERLLIPPTEGEHIHDVHILMTVNVNVIAATFWYGTNWMFLGS